MDGQMARWAEYFGQLFTVDPPTEQLHTTGLRAVDADPPIDETAPSLDEVVEQQQHQGRQLHRTQLCLAGAGQRVSHKTTAVTSPSVPARLYF
ncbi:hypothetical protein GWK47_040100 [Chionoecetes opilio]|uniref:Uncharacterized protein n=1 Tax=Chionoecetes opilio TaxID=41210 RepID=A0A8J4YJZ4_CHIOP|nr:hypothetical protein GWK47_040100 [Chionoecetes opilio]